jgi:hypothetical protein
MAPKNFKLRAFKVENHRIDSSESNVMDLLGEHLSETVANDRRMVLNEKDSDQDLICNYNIINQNYIWGSMLRISPSNEVLDIPDSYFAEEKINLQDLETLKDQGQIVYKSHYYFLLTNRYLITTLPGNITISRFQTYINWFLTSLRDELLYEFTPMVIIPPIYQLRALSKIAIQDPIIEVENEEKKFLSLSYLKDLFSDLESFDETKISEIVSAELLLKFKKPSKMTKQDYQGALGAYMKPISDTDNVTFYPKSGSPVKGSEILRVKPVKVERLESNNISENDLTQQMELYLSEIKE